MPSYDRQSQQEYLKHLTSKIKYYKKQNLHKLQYNLIIQYLQVHRMPAELTNRNEILNQLLLCSQKMKDNDKLIIAYQYVIKLSPPELNQFKIYTSFIQVLIQAERYQKAKVFIARVLSKFGENNLDMVRAYLKVCSKLGQFQEGLDNIQKYQLNNPNQKWCSSLCHWKILLYYQMGKHTTAITYCDQGTKQQPKHKQVFLQKKCHILILTHQYSKSLELAIELLNSGKLTNQKTQQIGALQSYCLLKFKKYEQSSQSIKKATKINPDSHMGVLKYSLLLKLNPNENFPFHVFKQNISFVLKQMKKREQLKERKAEIVKFFFNMHHMSIYIRHLQYLYENLKDYWEDKDRLEQYLELLFLSVLEGYEGSLRISKQLKQLNYLHNNKVVQTFTKQQQTTKITQQKQSETGDQR